MPNGDDIEDDPDDPPEIANEVNEAKRMIQAGRQKLDLARSARGILKPKNAPKRAETIDDVKARANCSVCKKRGHWHDDKDDQGRPVCLEYGKHPPPSKGKPKPPRKVRFTTQPHTNDVNVVQPMAPP